MRRLRKIILERMHKLEIMAIKIPRMVGIKFKEKLWREGFTSPAETEQIPAINRDETIEGPVYTEDSIIRKTFNNWR